MEDEQRPCMFEARLAALDALIARGVADADAGRVKSTAEVFDLLQSKLRAKPGGDK
jgi:antitoxin ParD1/3/4